MLRVKWSVQSNITRKPFQNTCKASRELSSHRRTRENWNYTLPWTWNSRGRFGFCLPCCSWLKVQTPNAFLSNTEASSFSKVFTSHKWMPFVGNHRSVSTYCSANYLLWTRDRGSLPENYNLTHRFPGRSHPGYIHLVSEGDWYRRCSQFDRCVFQVPCWDQRLNCTGCRDSDRTIPVGSGKENELFTARH